MPTNQLYHNWFDQIRKLRPGHRHAHLLRPPSGWLLHKSAREGHPQRNLAFELLKKLLKDAGLRDILPYLKIREELFQISLPLSKIGIMPEAK